MKWTRRTLAEHLTQQHEYTADDGATRYRSMAMPTSVMDQWTMDELENKHADFHGLPFPERAHGPADAAR